MPIAAVAAAHTKGHECCDTPCEEVFHEAVYIKERLPQLRNLLEAGVVRTDSDVSYFQHVCTVLEVRAIQVHLLSQQHAYTHASAVIICQYGTQVHSNDCGISKFEQAAVL